MKRNYVYYYTIVCQINAPEISHTSSHRVPINRETYLKSRTQPAMASHQLARNKNLMYWPDHIWEPNPKEI